MRKWVLLRSAITAAVLAGSATAAFAFTLSTETTIPAKTGHVPYPHAVDVRPDSIAPAPAIDMGALPKNDLNNLQTPGAPTANPPPVPSLDAPPTLGPTPTH